MDESEVLNWLRAKRSNEAPNQTYSAQKMQIPPDLVVKSQAIDITEVI
jgi:hypothetical protein